MGSVSVRASFSFLPFAFSLAPSRLTLCSLLTGRQGQETDAVAEFELELIRERVKADMDRAARQGKKIGRARVTR